jgi:cell division protein FtsI/penicillin-binding protein 2
MKKSLFLCLLVFAGTVSFAQHITKSDAKTLRQKEDSLKSLSVKIIQGINPEDRFNADSIFTKIFVRALKTPNSFYYNFDSLETISKLYAPDSSFKIFTWQMVFNENVIRQHGAIQMRTYDGSLKLFPLIDKSDVTINMADTVGNNRGWIGAVYYNIIQKKSGNQDYYTLLGYY